MSQQLLTKKRILSASLYLWWVPCRRSSAMQQGCLPVVMYLPVLLILAAQVLVAGKHGLLLRRLLRRLLGLRLLFLILCGHMMPA